MTLRLSKETLMKLIEDDSQDVIGGQNKVYGCGECDTAPAQCGKQLGKTKCGKGGTCNTRHKNCKKEKK